MMSDLKVFALFNAYSGAINQLSDGDRKAVIKFVRHMRETLDKRITQLEVQLVVEAPEADIAKGKHRHYVIEWKTFAFDAPDYMLGNSHTDYGYQVTGIHIDGSQFDEDEVIIMRKGDTFELLGLPPPNPNEGDGE